MVDEAWAAVPGPELEALGVLPKEPNEDHYPEESLNGYPLLERVFMNRKVGMNMAVGLPSSDPRGWLGLTVTLGLTMLSLGGCGDPSTAAGPLYPVKGKVLLADGKPLTTGRVEFLPVKGGMPAAGDIGSDGSFSLKTGDGREGAPAGDYRVRIEPKTLAAKKQGKPASFPFPAKYVDEDGYTGLTATVLAEPTTLEPFKLTGSR